MFVVRSRRKRARALVHGQPQISSTYPNPTFRGALPGMDNPAFEPVYAEPADVPKLSTYEVPKVGGGCGFASFLGHDCRAF